MSFAQGFTQYDLAIAKAKQSAKGTVPTTFKSATGPTKITPTINKQVIPGEPYLGGDAYMQKAVGVGFDNGFSEEGWITLDMLPHILLAGLATKGTTVVTFTTVNTHPYTFLKRNSTFPYISSYEDWGEATPGSGIQTIIKRDLRMTSLNITGAQGAPVMYTANYDGLNEGPGAASPTITANTAYNVPDPNSTVWTYPSFFPTVDKLCLESWNISWNGNPVKGPYCIGSGERSDNYITKMGWSGDMTFTWSTDMVAVYDKIVYGTTTPTANASQQTAAIAEGALSCTLASTSIIPSSTTPTPFSWLFTFPDVQWWVVKPTDDTPNTLQVTWNTFGSAMTSSVVNGTTSANASV